MTKTYFNLMHQSQTLCQNHQTDFSIAYLLMFYYSQKVKNRSDYISLMHQEIDFDWEKFWTDLSSVAIKKINLARITQSTAFYGSDFVVLPEVFIPRHETEIVVDATLKAITNLKILTPINLIDLCAGTGAIGLSLKLVLKQKINLTLVDLNNQAIQNIKINAAKMRCKINCICDDWLTHLKKVNYDVIVANFPYVGIKDQIDKNLVLNDPALALYAENDGFDYYDQLLAFLSRNQSWKLVVLETSAHHEKKWLKVQALSKNYSFDFLYDWNHFLRVVVIRKC